MLQGRVGETKSQSLHTCEIVAGTRFRYILQRHILSSVLTLFHSCNMESVQNLFPQQRTEFNLLNFMGHVAATELCVRRLDHRVQGCATCPCSKN